MSSARRNNATRAEFTNYDLANPFAEGGFRWVAKGIYTHGERRGEACVCKWFKSGFVYEDSYFDLDIRANDKALEIIEEWNIRRYVNKVVKINMPEVWTFSGNSSGSWSGRKVLQEPFISNYRKYNSNSGWALNSSPWPRVMQALSHFSYHITGGQCVLCDLQGGEYGDAICLTDPVILSRSRSYGVTDLGPEGISSFFCNHVCNEFCKSNWIQPRDQNRYHRLQAGTSMIRARTGANQAVTRYMDNDYDDDDDCDY
mmetsp:Transcript_13447/g.20448  ORF Transcript_13447/g.20448 Transcript_13447/m.20448 type:complete len:257 (+) Transcript_13447:259-1029(+)|eukprot:CAMPEP_0196814864 /NCGR_PEP_ID=MMETSP1362-20130617/46238_1 /TAXON_ID=163516 /ORGANISM="Leptocylindrus danicus, Strain CCMP1856" /LENGTH=256 /DNA_ID=CAMNT_0042191625 /DNA_START=151 /DNA_END=921 /DNA_ORIENTATION=+